MFCYNNDVYLIVATDCRSYLYCTCRELMVAAIIVAHNSSLSLGLSRCRKLLQATVRANRTGHFMWVGSDSWGAKVYPVRDQEFAAEGAITILPYRNALKGKGLLTMLV